MTDAQAAPRHAHLLAVAALCLAGCEQPQATKVAAAEAEPAPAAPAQANPQPKLTSNVGPDRVSVFTSLRPNDCTLVERNDEEAGYSRYRCAGPSGYSLEAIESDGRQSLVVRAGSGANHKLELSAFFGGGFSTLGDTAEWRGSAAAQFTPETLTFRYAVVEDPDRPERPTSYLGVARLGKERTCVIAKIAPGERQSLETRRIADTRPLPACRPHPAAQTGQ